MKKISKKLLSCALAVLCILSCFIMPASAATSAQFGSSSYCQVTIADSLIKKSGKQYATVKLSTYSMGGKFNSGGKVVVTLKDEKNRVIWSGMKKGGDTLKLGDDHRVYRIYVKVYYEPATGGIFRRTFINGNNFTNSGKCNTWKITNPKNCTIK